MILDKNINGAETICCVMCYQKVKKNKDLS